MNKQQAKRRWVLTAKRRVRAKVFGTPERPRLAVHRTNANIYAQLIDDAFWKNSACLTPLLQRNTPEFRSTEARLAPTRRQLTRSELIGKRAAEKNVTEATWTVAAVSITAASRLWQMAPATRLKF